MKRASPKQDSRKMPRKAPRRAQDRGKGLTEQGILDSMLWASKQPQEATKASQQASQTPSPAPDSFSNLLKEVQSLHDKKKADYAKTGDRFSNFRLAAIFSGIETFQSIENLIGIKQARLLELRNPRNETRTPLNESVRDSLIDRAIYSLLAVLFYDEYE